MDPEPWRVLQSRLIDYVGGDTNCKNQSRLMRLPGFRYVDKTTGKLTANVAQLIHQSTGCYSAAEIEACLPALPPPAPAKAAKAAPAPLLQQLPARELQEIQKAVAVLPHRSPQTYEQFRNALCGCSAALAEAGVVAADAEAINLMAHLWEGGEGQAAQILGSTTTRKATSFWAIAREHGYDLKRSAPAPAAKQQDKPAAATGKATPDKPVTFEDRWKELEDHAAVVACSDWPVMKAVASLASKAGDLEVNRLTGRNLEQLLEQAHRAVRAKADPIAGGGTFKVKTTPWAVDGLFRHGLNLLVGQSGAGKSRLAAACMAAWLRGDQTWLNLPLNGIEPEHRHALIVGSDQTLEDWAITLEPVGLCKRLDAETVRIHPNLTLYGLETAVGLDADGLAMIRRWVDHHPGGMVLVDSLSSCLPPGIDEATKAAGRPVRQLQEVLGDAWGIQTPTTPAKVQAKRETLALALAVGLETLTPQPHALSVSG